MTFSWALYRMREGYEVERPGKQAITIGTDRDGKESIVTTVDDVVYYLTSGDVLSRKWRLTR